MIYERVVVICKCLQNIQFISNYLLNSNNYEYSSYDKVITIKTTNNYLTLFFLNSTPVSAEWASIVLA